MFRKIIENKRKLDALKQECFDARARLIAVADESNESAPRGCIKLKYSIECGVLDAWRVGMKPEDTYRVIGPQISYCCEFDAINPMRHQCRNKNCPMYARYQNYLMAYKQVQDAKTK
ncbi:MAG: hypothetical protein IJ866_02665 [Alphaproteobacteria bacterium]|nr:hypothetical protein [Alphaproteobacteria bacterium]